MNMSRKYAIPSPCDFFFLIYIRISGPKAGKRDNVKVYRIVPDSSSLLKGSPIRNAYLNFRRMYGTLTLLYVVSRRCAYDHEQCFVS